MEAQSQFPNSIGRGCGNNIVITIIQVNKFHTIFKEYLWIWHIQTHL